MASAGVVGMAEVVQPNSVNAGQGWTGTPFMWSVIWAALAFAFLVWAHMNLLSRG